MKSRADSNDIAKINKEACSCFLVPAVVGETGVRLGYAISNRWANFKVAKPPRNGYGLGMKIRGQCKTSDDVEKGVTVVGK